MRQHIFELGVVDYLIKSEINDSLIQSYFDAFKQMQALSYKIKEINIVVLDDSHLSLSIIKHFFKLTNFNNVTYYSDCQALANDPTIYDVYILDLSLPKMSGEDILVNIRHRHPKSIIIVLSSITNNNTISRTLLMGADDYIMKPFHANILMARLKLQLKYYLIRRD